MGRALMPILTYAKTPLEAAVPAAGLIAGTVATYNSFVWNRLWTFEAEGLDDEKKQLVRFFVVAGGGIAIATGVKAGVYRLLPMHSVLIPNVCGALVGGVWNFVVQRAWTFRRPS
jgi:putative flippase GtrA